MEIDPEPAGRNISQIILIVMLAVMAGGLFVVTAMAANLAGEVENIDQRRVLARIAWVAISLMGLALVVLLWTVMRYFRSRMQLGQHREPTPYVDAWSLAGKRMQVPTEEDDEDE